MSDEPQPPDPITPGQHVRIVRGTFENFEGVVLSVDAERQKVRVEINIFSRLTPVEGELADCEPLGESKISRRPSGQTAALGVHFAALDVQPRLPIGLLLVGHGSRQPSDEFRRVAAMVSDEAPHIAVEACYLEFEEPTIATAFARLMERHVRRVVVVPVMLFAAEHVKRDIPASVAAAAVAHPHVTINYAEHLGCHPMLLELSFCRYSEAIAAAGLDRIRGESTVLLMVGRGSRDPQATAEMHEFVRRRAELTPLSRALGCFVAMATPTIDEALKTALELHPARIVVQPHFLFNGVLLARIAERVDRFAAENVQLQLIRTQALGPAPQLVQALLDRASAVLPH